MHHSTVGATLRAGHLITPDGKLVEVPDPDQEILEWEQSLELPLDHAAVKEALMRQVTR